MKEIKSFNLFKNSNRKIVYRGLRREFDMDFDGVEYYAENKSYARVFGNNIKAFYLDERDVMDLDVWNSKLSQETRDRYHGNLFTIHSTYMYKESEDYGYRYLRDTIFRDLNREEFNNFQKEFNNARIIKGRDSGNESQIVYAVRDKSLVEEV